MVYKFNASLSKTITCNIKSINLSKVLKNKQFILQQAKIFVRYNSGGGSLYDVLSEKIPCEQERIRNFVKEYGSAKVGEVTINMIYGGMRGLLGLVCETSVCDPEEGVRFRGYTIQEIRKLLPKAEGGEEPLPEGHFWLLVTSDIPTKEQVKQLSSELADRSKLPQHVLDLLKNMPTTMHPLCQLSCCLISLNQDSKFAQSYLKGTNKAEYWKCTYQDAIELIAKVPVISAMIYRRTYCNDKSTQTVDPNLDWAGNFANMLGIEHPHFAELMRLYMTIHSDHEAGNVSAHTTHLVGSSLADPFLSYAAGVNGLAGPLHALSLQQAWVWLTTLQKTIGNTPTDDQVRDFVKKTIDSGQVIPGFGHAILRKIDPRFVVQHEFALKHLPQNDLFKLVSKVVKVTPEVLKEKGTVQNIWPNLDANYGLILHHYGLRETMYYAMFFGVSRSLGVMAQLIWNRALNSPIERPKSLSTDLLMKMVKK